MQMERELSVGSVTEIGHHHCGPGISGQVSPIPCFSSIYQQGSEILETRPAYGVHRVKTTSPNAARGHTRLASASRQITKGHHCHLDVSLPNNSGQCLLECADFSKGQFLRFGPVLGDHSAQEKIYSVVCGVPESPVH